MIDLGAFRFVVFVAVIPAAMVFFMWRAVKWRRSALRLDDDATLARRRGHDRALAAYRAAAAESFRQLLVHRTRYRMRITALRAQRRHDQARIAELTAEVRELRVAHEELRRLLARRNVRTIDWPVVGMTGAGACHPPHRGC